MNLFRIFLFATALLGLAGGFAVPQLGLGGLQGLIWGVAAGVVLAALLSEIVTSLARGEVGLDLVAGLSISAALAFGETLAAGVVALMYAGGQLLEDYAANRARLIEALPRMGLVRLCVPDGAFYVYVDVADYTDDSLAFCRRLLAETGVAITPGIDFDTVHGGSHVRFSFAGSLDVDVVHL